MLEEALVVLLYIALIVFVIALTVLCIKLIGTLSRADRLIENVTKKVETLDGVFGVLDTVSNKFGLISESIINGISGLINKLFGRKRKYESEEEYYE